VIEYQFARFVYRQPVTFAEVDQGSVVRLHAESMRQPAQNDRRAWKGCCE
jgi:hypothetical protein